MDKDNIRSRLLQQRRELNQELQIQHSKIICEKIIAADFYRNSKTIAAYVALGNEVDCTPLFKTIFADNTKKLYLPAVIEGIQFYEYLPNETYSYNQLNVAEPPVKNKQPIETASLDLIIMPLVGFDEKNNRIGRGAGYYDRVLAFTHQVNLTQRPLLVGAAYQFQKVPNIVPDRWDIPLDCVITE